jgi:hypothetical protein
MSFNYDVDELDDDVDLDAVDDVSAEDSGSEYEDLDGNFEDIDFEALGINPQGPTLAKPGSEAKVLMLAARYAAGVPLWHDSDCYDHGPGEAMARMLRMGGQAAPKN